MPEPRVALKTLFLPVAISCSGISISVSSCLFALTPLGLLAGDGDSEPHPVFSLSHLFVLDFHEPLR